jgi:hypothetical protein
VQVGGATTCRRNIILGNSFSAGGSVATIQIDAGASIFDTAVAFNVYSSVAVGIVNNTTTGNGSYIFEPNGNNITITGNTAGTRRHEIKNRRNSGAGDNAEYRASAVDGAVQAVVRAALASPNAAELGSTTDTIVNLICNSIVGAQLRRESQIGSNETALMLRVDRTGTKTLSTVSIGAPDSGGAGFKVLRVAN